MLACHITAWNASPMLIQSSLLAHNIGSSIFVTITCRRVCESHLGTRLTAAGIASEARRTCSPGSALGSDLVSAGRIPNFGNFPWSSCALLHFAACLALLLCLLRLIKKDIQQVGIWMQCKCNMPALGLIANRIHRKHCNIKCSELHAQIH